MKGNSKEEITLLLLLLLLLFLKILFIYLTDRSQVGREAGRERREETGSLLSREPDVGLDPRTLGS